MKVVQLLKMLHKIQCRIYEKDSFNRIKCYYPDQYREDRKDTLNTRLQMEQFDTSFSVKNNKTNKDYWHPNFKSMFLAKLTNKTFGYDQFGESISKGFTGIVGQIAELEVEFLPFANYDYGQTDYREGWFIQVYSIRLLA